MVERQERRAVEPPSRDLEPEATLPTVRVRSPGFHTFIFRKMVMGPEPGPRPNDGDLVRVIDRDGVPLGFGLYNSKSQIPVRLISRGQEPPGPGFWESRIDEAVELRRRTLGLDEAGDAYRLVHAEGDGLSGLIVDKFGDVLSAEVFSLGVYQRIGPLMARLLDRAGAAEYRVHVDHRIAQAEMFAGRPVATEGAPEKVEIREHGVRYRVRFEGGHKTGFFCDQRDNRRGLARFCEGREVLDVCCYSGGFGLSALVNGGAKEVTGVDLDEKAVAMAKENANLNQVRMKLVHSDAFNYMRQMGADARAFGVVALDPPKLIGSRLEMDEGRKKYLDLNTLALGLVEPGGLLLTCSCSGLLPAEEFLGIVRSAARRAGRSARVLATTGAGPDHPVGLEDPEGGYLKAAWLLVGERQGRPPAVE
ncbi:Ribosomal RNA large subunit methyltransferase I [Tautonia plasticadhaerens]|uniref:Ribosomal RNA large subunit methyltransferase I n=1 Tax=Tautonia plasticadhaerens TaxID=2527974 RepID=A0A518HB23_9BACT|nr:Ribosomal RNA large subunit methyltransferase I [Tautonia plasticadhaerens]